MAPRKMQTVDRANCSIARIFGLLQQLWRRGWALDRGRMRTGQCIEQRRMNRTLFLLVIIKIVCVCVCVYGVL